MGALIVRTWSAEAWDLQRKQHGVVAHVQLRQLGMSKKAIAHRLESGRLHSLHHGVYAVGRPEVGRRGRWMAATLACAPSALLSHRSAAVLWGIHRKSPGPVEVVVPPQRRVRRRGIRAHRRTEPVAARAVGGAAITVLEVEEARLPRPRLGPSRDRRRWSYRWRREGIPVTGPIPTLIDLAASESVGVTEAAVNEADHLGLVDPESLRIGIELFPLRPGARRLRDLLDAATHTLTTTELERCFLRLALEVGLPPPESQRQLGPNRVDFLWPQLNLVVETDSLRYHRTAFKQAADKRRDNANMRRGLITLRFTHGQLNHEPAYVRAELQAVVELVDGRGRKVPL